MKEFADLDAEEWLPDYMRVMIDGLGETVDIAAETGKSAGRALVAGVVQGADSNDLWAKLHRIFEQGLITKISTLLGIASPSKVYAEFGRSMMQGLSMGITSGMPTLDGLARPSLLGGGMRSPSVGGSLAGPGTMTAGPVVNNHYHQNDFHVGFGSEGERMEAVRLLREAEREVG